MKFSQMPMISNCTSGSFGYEKHQELFSWDFAGISPKTTALVDVYWKEKNVDSEWVCHETSLSFQLRDQL